MPCRTDSHCLVYGPCVVGDGEGLCDRNPTAICDVDAECGDGGGPCVLPIKWCSKNIGISCVSDADCIITDAEDFGTCVPSKVCIICHLYLHVQQPNVYIYISLLDRKVFVRRMQLCIAILILSAKTNNVYSLERELVAYRK